MAYGLYAVGYLLVIAGISYIAHLMRIPQEWIVGIVIVLLGVGAIGGAQKMGAAK
jgi:TctA family transporter